MVNKQVKRCLVSLTSRITRCHLIPPLSPPSTATSEKQKMTGAGEDVEKPGRPCASCREDMTRSVEAPQKTDTAWDPSRRPVPPGRGLQRTLVSSALETCDTKVS